MNRTSDIHANIDAFTAVLADTDQFPVCGMPCLGDIVGYGGFPSAYRRDAETDLDPLKFEMTTRGTKP